MTQPPPIIPGSPEPFTLASVLPVGKPPRRRWWVVLAVAAAAVVIVLAGTAFWLVALRPTALRQAYEACDETGRIADNDRTLILDTPGEGGGSSDSELSEMVCVLSQLQAPSYVVARMEQTSALDGQVTETWADFQATWTYSPNRGLDVIIRLV